MRVSGRFLFSAAVALVAGWALLETRGWGIKAALYPRVVALPLLLLAAAESVLCLRGAALPAEAADEEEPDTRKTAVIAAWIAGLFGAVILLGFQAAVPLFVLGYLRAQGREGWGISVVLAFLAGLVFHLLFVNLLHLPLPAGLLWRAVGR